MKSETIGDDLWARVPDDVREELRRLITSDIARAEGRHPSAVLADIAGPARAASVGRACAVGMDGPWLWGGCNRLDGKCRDIPARGAGEESA